MKLNPRLVRFIVLFLVTCGAWQALYELWLAPNARLDEWLAFTVASQAGGLLQLFGFSPEVSGRVITGLGGRGVLVADGCNGLPTMGLFLGFVLAYPGRWMARLLFIPLGVLVIHVANVVRVALMAILEINAPLIFEALHSVGTYFFYAIIFGLWMVWMHIDGLRNLNLRLAGAPAQPHAA